MTQLPRIILWGAAGHARVLAEAIADRFQIGAIFDRRELESPIPGIDIRVGWDEFTEWRNKNGEPGWFFAIAIGGDRGADRLDIDTRLRAESLTPATAVSYT